MTYHDHAAQAPTSERQLLEYLAYRWPVEAGQMFAEAATCCGLNNATELAGQLAVKAEAAERDLLAVGIQTRMAVAS